MACVEVFLRRFAWSCLIWDVNSLRFIFTILSNQILAGDTIFCVGSSLFSASLVSHQRTSSLVINDWYFTM